MVHGRFFRPSLLVCPDQAIYHYRKAHLPRLGADNYSTPGDTELIPFHTPVGCIGMLICYDLRFPEAARTLALRGADILVVIANWPVGATDYPDFLTRARASENRLPIVVANRTGTERGVTFGGRSQALLPDGMVLAEAGRDAGIMLAQFDHEQVTGRREATL